MKMKSIDKEKIINQEQCNHHDVYASQEDINRVIHSGIISTLFSMSDKIVLCKKLTYKDLLNSLMEGVKEFKELEKERDKLWRENMDLEDEICELKNEIKDLEYGDASLLPPAQVEAVYLADNVIQFPGTRRAANAK